MSDIFGDENDGLQEMEQEAEVSPEPTPEPTQEVKQDSQVPLSALNESRAQLRQTQAELSQMREKMQSVDELRDQLQEFRSRDRQQTEEDRFNTDPLGALREQMSKLDQKIDHRETEQQERGQQEQQEQQMFHSIASQVNQFKETVPDYDDALQHVLQGRKAEFVAMGMPETEALNRVSAEAQNIATTALQNGQNPGQVVYALAKVRGYTQQKNAQQENAQKIERVGKGQKAASSLSGSSGDAGDQGFSLGEIDHMSDEEFDRFWEAEMKPKNR